MRDSQSPILYSDPVAADRPNYVKIMMYGNHCLRDVCDDVIDPASRDIQYLGDVMTAVIRTTSALGLAAPQIGKNCRVIAVNMIPEIVVIVNPEIIGVGESESSFEEGCLSIPGAVVSVDRPSNIVIQGYNTEGNRIERELNGLLASVVQHEIDHLDGRLMIDYLGEAKRDITLRKHRKFVRRYQLPVHGYKVRIDKTA